MAWQYAGQVQVSGRSWSQAIPVVSPQLRLTYHSINPTVLKVQFYGWLRIFYSEHGLYSDRWDRIWPKVEQEFVSLHPWEPLLGQHAIQFRQGGRLVAVDGWSVTVEYWLSSDKTDAPLDEDDLDLLIGEETFTVDNLPIEFT